MPWGQTGVTTNAVCLAALHRKLHAHEREGHHQAAECFMHQQLGYLTNHKCAAHGQACDTSSDAGYSYIAGCAPAVHVPFVVFAAPSCRASHVASTWIDRTALAVPARLVRCQVPEAPHVWCSDHVVQ